MIIWIASYPKSGNTWVRSLISALVYTENGIFNFQKLKYIPQFPDKAYFKNLTDKYSDINYLKKYWIVAQDKINLDKKIKFFKTHHLNCKIDQYSFTNDSNTKAKIYIVRDPRNLVNSISNHFSLSIEDAFRFLSSPEMIGNTKSWDEKKTGMVNVLGKWNDHYRSWTRDKNNLLIIKYEDLISNAANELDKIIIFLRKYIKFETNKTKNDKILKSTSFNKLKKMEEQGLFKENVLNKNDNSKVKFFNLGPENKWQDNLKQNFVKKIEKNFYTEMKELNYL